jgi:CRP-like cAMP-binding protein
VKVRHVLRRTGDQIDTVYFPDNGVWSFITTMPDGGMVEAATVGADGMIGVEAALSLNAVASSDSVLQVGDATVQAMSLGAFRAELARDAALRDLVNRYAQVLLATTMQTAACNSLHQLPNRCARWLLMTHDRVNHAEFGLSQEFLAAMLGVQRPTVTVAAGALQEAGIIRYRHGRITIVDRERLEDASCDCYRIVREHIARAGLAYPKPTEPQ